VSAIPWGAGGAGNYYPLARQVRFMDTRTGQGAPKARLAAGRTVHLQITNRGGVPASGVSAVVLNLTAVAPSATTSLTAYATGARRPTGQSLWADAHSVLDSNVTVSLGSGGRVDITNTGSGSTDVVVDVYGYYAADTSVVADHGEGGQFANYDFSGPVRIVDTREGSGAKVAPGDIFQVPVEFNEPFNEHVTAVALSVTALGGTAAGGFSIYGTGDFTKPANASVHFTKNSLTQNLVIVPVTDKFDPNIGDNQPYIAFANPGKASAHILIDVVGFYDDNTVPFQSRYVPFSTVPRLVDSSKGIGIPADLHVSQAAIDPGTHADLNETFTMNLGLTAARPTKTTSLTIWPAVPADLGGPVPIPGAGRVQAPAGKVTVSTVMPATGLDNLMTIFNFIGSVSVRVDAQGRFDGMLTPDMSWNPEPDTSAGLAAQARISSMQPANRLSGYRSAAVHRRAAGRTLYQPAG
jgi:hypothetical protein